MIYNLVNGLALGMMWRKHPKMAIWPIIVLPVHNLGLIFQMTGIVLGKFGLVWFKPLLAKPQTKPLRISQTKLKLKPNYFKLFQTKPFQTNLGLGLGCNVENVYKRRRMWILRNDNGLTSI
jgi:hypothetical protein